jgi:hypothetical protein
MQTKVLAIKSTVTGQFPDSESNDNLCDFASVAICKQMSTIFGADQWINEELRTCVIDSCVVTGPANTRRLRSLATVQKTIDLDLSVTIETTDTTEPKITAGDLAGAVEDEGTSW